jgi:molybdopterin molybdotransferase
LIEEAGAIPIRFGIVPDHFAKLSQVASQALSTTDLVVITAGSSASSRDLTSQIVDQLGEPGVLVHGINVKPGKPTILGVAQGKAVIGLPGNPVSALVVAGLILKPLIRHLTGQPLTQFNPSIQAKLNLNIPSQAGREDWIPVRLEMRSDQIVAEPVFGKSNLIFTLSRADGLIRIPPESNGLAAGVDVQVIML